MRRLWILISGYNDANGLERAARSVRGAWPDPDRCPIVYADGAYSKFPHDRPHSTDGTAEVAARWATFVVTWPVASPTEFLKRSSYWAGLPGDLALIVDTDETVEASDPEAIFALDFDSYGVPLRDSTDPPGTVHCRPHRLFNVTPSIHHWGAHEAVFDPSGRIYMKRPLDPAMLSLVHHPRQPEREALKVDYYQTGIREDESSFRYLCRT